MAVTRLEADPNWATAAPFRDHVRDLLTTTGISYPYYAALAGISPRAIRRLLHERRPLIHVALARAILACDQDTITAAPTTRVPAKPTRQLLTALTTLGWTRTDLLHHLPSQDVALLGSRALYCTQATQARVHAVHDAAIRTHHHRPHPARRRCH